MPNLEFVARGLCARDENALFAFRNLSARDRHFVQKRIREMIGVTVVGNEIYTILGSRLVGVYVSSLHDPPLEETLYYVAEQLVNVGRGTLFIQFSDMGKGKGFIGQANIVLPKLIGNVARTIFEVDSKQHVVRQNELCTVTMQATLGHAFPSIGFLFGALIGVAFNMNVALGEALGSFPDAFFEVLLRNEVTTLPSDNFRPTTDAEVEAALLTNERDERIRTISDYEVWRMRRRMQVYAEQCLHIGRVVGGFHFTTTEWLREIFDRPSVRAKDVLCGDRRRPLSFVFKGEGLNRRRFQRAVKELDRKDLMIFCTGNTYDATEDPVVVSVREGGGQKNALPTSSTCTRHLFLPDDLRSQKDLRERLETAFALSNQTSLDDG